MEQPTADDRTADADEVARFAQLAERWWDARGPLAPLHRLNPTRIRYIRDTVAARLGRDPERPRPLDGLTLLDIGCGGGLIAEPMVRLGARVTGIDAAAANIAAARLHAEAVGLDIDGGTFRAARVLHDGRERRVGARAVVVASGGFEANTDWLREAWGPVADNFLIRGTRYNTGRMLRVLLDQGAARIGDPTQCHAVAIDARAPKFDGGIVTRLDCVSLGIVVNREARRFYDEGEDFWPRRYAIWGRLVAGQPDQIAYSIIDDKARGKFMPSVYPPIEAGSIRELAARLDLDPDALEATVADFNRAVRPGTFDHTTLDDCRTAGIDPPKTHWARAIDTPPFAGYPLRPGITFTYLGVKVTGEGEVVMEGSGPATNIFAAGEVMAGNVLGQGYAAGVGMTIGTVSGRIAGESAARRALGLARAA